MVRKCCVTNCRSNYDYKPGDNTVTVYRLPKNQDERGKWLNNIPRENIPITSNTVVCEKHWPTEVTSKLGGTKRPQVPPTVFQNIPQSQIPTPAPTPRPTSRAHSPTRNVLPDQYKKFKASDQVRYEEILGKFDTRLPDFSSAIRYVYEEKLIFVSPVLLQNSIPKFTVKIHPNLKFEAYQAGTRVFPFGRLLGIHKLQDWTAISELFRYLENSEVPHKNQILLQHVNCMNNLNVVGVRVYDMEVILRAFNYYATSRSCYRLLYKDLQLPSINTLRKLTCKTKSINDLDYVKQVFTNLSDTQSQSIIIVDEVHVKPILLYSGGELFGEAANRPGELANRVLGIMVLCLFGGPVFLAKVIPVRRLDAKFQKEQVTLVSDAIKEGDGKVIAILLDNSHVNQSYINAFPTEPGKPWVMTDNLTGEKTFILNDYVHLFKSVRNNWYTERTKEISYYCPNDNDFKVAKWDILTQLYNLDKDLLVNVGHTLNLTAISPKPIERQNVNTMLRVFSDKTVAALLNHKGLQESVSNQNDIQNTADFIQTLVDVWTICNVRSPYIDVRLRDPRRQVLRQNCDVTNSNLDKLLALADMVELMDARNGKCRVKSFTKDTAKALCNTLRGLVDMARHLLAHGSGFDYVMLGQFSSDPIEKEFGKQRQGAGGTYFITVRDIVQKTNIEKTQLALDLDIVSLDTSDVEHSCSACDRMLSGEECDLFEALSDPDNLSELEKVLDESTKTGLVHISGYVQKKHNVESEHDTFEYFDKYGNYTDHLNRGGLTKPNDSTVQWVFMAYYFFVSLENKFECCRKSLGRYLIDLADSHNIAKN